MSHDALERLNMQHELEIKKHSFFVVVVVEEKKTLDHTFLYSTLNEI